MVQRVLKRVDHRNKLFKTIIIRRKLKNKNLRLLTLLSSKKKTP